MKVITFILSAYLLFLFAVPCCSFDNCTEDNTAQTANHETGDGECGSCSPFFTCAGCSGATLSFNSTHIEIITQDPMHYYTGFILSSTSDVHYDFWQPPKLNLI